MRLNRLDWNRRGNHWFSQMCGSWRIRKSFSFDLDLTFHVLRYLFRVIQKQTARDYPDHESNQDSFITRFKQTLGGQSPALCLLLFNFMKLFRISCQMVRSISVWVNLSQPFNQNDRKSLKPRDRLSCSNRKTFHFTMNSTVYYTLIEQPCRAFRNARSLPFAALSPAFPFDDR